MLDVKAFYKISYGMYIVASKMGDEYNGQIANTVFQVSSDPPTLAVSINKLNLTSDCILGCRVFTVSVLSQDTPMSFIGLFGFKSGRDIKKFQGVSHRAGITGAPIVLDHALSYFEVEVVSHLDAGTHSIFLGKVVDGAVLRDGEPMTYAYYREVKKGTSPKAAPTFIKEPAVQETPKMPKYRCTVCGYIYDPEKGDPDSGVAPGTPFDKVPDSWVCPVCGATKDLFEKV